MTQVAPSAAVATDFTATPVPLVSGGFWVRARSSRPPRLSPVTSRPSRGPRVGTGYAVGDVLTFGQGAVSGTYTLIAADVTAGVVAEPDG